MPARDRANVDAVPARVPCLACGRLNRGRSYCRGHEPPHESPSSRYGLKRSPAARRAVLERDGHACVRCGATENLRVHHAEPVADGGTNDEENLFVLCDPCHVELHRAARDREDEQDAEDLLLLGEL
jgi:5-methylcytosine-specific restriction endonuclease McrA